jgi:hypothetical protein
MLNGTGPSESADDDLPSVMTCANYLKLPPYSTKVLYLVIKWTSNYLGFFTSSGAYFIRALNRRSCTRNCCMQSVKGRDLLTCHEFF